MVVQCGRAFGTVGPCWGHIGGEETHKHDAYVFPMCSVAHSATRRAAFCNLTLVSLLSQNFAAR